MRRSREASVGFVILLAGVVLLVGILAVGITFVLWIVVRVGWAFAFGR